MLAAKSQVWPCGTGPVSGALGDVCGDSVPCPFCLRWLTAAPVLEREAELGDGGNAKEVMSGESSQKSPIFGKNKSDILSRKRFYSLST